MLDFLCTLSSPNSFVNRIPFKKNTKQTRNRIIKEKQGYRCQLRKYFLCEIKRPKNNISFQAYLHVYHLSTKFLKT